MTGSWTQTSGTTGHEPMPLDSHAPKEIELTQVGRYRLCYELASGGMATVYLARMDGPHGFEKLVALKRIHPHLVSERRYVEMFLDEARIASGITHPNVCTVFDFGESGGEYFLTMEYLVGEPLARVYRRVAASAEQRESPLLPFRMARIIEEACEGLHAAHESKDANGQPLNVVHRDVSPKNLFMTYSGVVQVVDFGIASARQRTHRTATGHLKGTMPYTAPEQISGGTVDRRGDIWGLGVVLWELLTFDRLFRRETEVETMYAVLVGDIPAPSERRPDIPPELDGIVMKALQRDPNKRWHTAREMGQALHAFASKQAEHVGAAELSSWMDELFPQGEASRREIMDRALTRGFQVPGLSQGVDDELTGEATVAAGMLPGLASKSKPRPRWVRPAIALSALSVLLAGAWGFRELPTRSSPSTALVPWAPAPVVLPSEPASAEPIANQALPTEAPVTQEASAEQAEVSKPEVVKPEVAEPEVAEPKPSARKKVARKPRPRKKPSKPVEAAPTATGLPGHIKILTKGHTVEIYEGATLLGRAPGLLTLPAGRHRLRLKSMESGESLTLPVTVVANATKTISLDLD
jgi:serine/threonine protein kinase